MNKLSWDPYHEGIGLPEDVETYWQRFGDYPAVVIADKIYTRENVQFCTSHGIHLSGPRLGMPPKQTDKRQRLFDSLTFRNP